MKLRELFVAKTDVRQPSKAERRIATLPTHELVPWAEQCIYTVGRGLNDWARDAGRLELLDEAYQGAESLLLVVEEIRRRAQI